MTLVTRKPTAKPSWPVLLIAGVEKSGKSWACAQASASERIGRTLWVSIGETDPDQYGAIPGADFEIVEHDGSYKGILEVLAEIASLPAEDKPTLLVVDSMTRLWDLIGDGAQKWANTRAKGDSEGIITMDLWNKANKYWAHLIQAILAHDGPVLMTARLEAVTVVDSRGKPTPVKADKIKTKKSLPYDVDGVIEMPERGKTYISAVRSVNLQLQERTEFPNFTVDDLWSKLGLDDVQPRVVSNVALPEGDAA
ncbi:AAA family ATPase [Rhodococcus globerulus]|uniref:AAA family ATPase n=1 Tax=Rhodococcus globerulus TaxID=33008 RepID=UPI001C56D810|nr:AAA family ATPase [Rhodococcus globerulus]QXW04041.1 ATP-binding protein [Rhodococcus globerulus]